MRKILILLCVVCTMVGTASMAEAAAPSNDDIANATVVTGVPFSDATNNAEATGEPDAGCGIAATVWYQYTPTESGFLDFNAYGSEVESVVALYSGTPGNLTNIACNYWQVTPTSRRRELLRRRRHLRLQRDRSGGREHRLHHPGVAATGHVDHRDGRPTGHGDEPRCCDDEWNGHLRSAGIRIHPADPRAAIPTATCAGRRVCVGRMWADGDDVDDAILLADGDDLRSGEGSHRWLCLCVRQHSSVYTDLSGELQLRRGN